MKVKNINMMKTNQKVMLSSKKQRTAVKSSLTKTIADAIKKYFGCKNRILTKAEKLDFEGSWPDYMFTGADAHENISIYVWDCQVIMFTDDEEFYIIYDEHKTEAELITAIIQEIAPIAPTSWREHYKKITALERIEIIDSLFDN
jgi:hypothetical protein